MALAEPANVLAAGSVTLSDPDTVGGRVWWCESQPAGGGRIALVRETSDGEFHRQLDGPARL